MGNCMSNDEIKGSHSYFHQDVLLEQKSQIYKPLTTTLYNTLRKTSDCVLIANHNSTLSSETIDIMKIDFEKATSNHLKTLLNFKKIIYVGSLQKDGETNLKKIKQTVSFTKLYVVSQDFFKAFLKENPIFLKQNWTKYEIVTNKLPLMIIDSNQFVNKTQPRIKLFIHASAKKNLQIYKLLGITSQNMIINEPSSQGSIEHKKAYYVSALKNMKQHMIVFLHNPAMSSTQICDTLSTFLSQKYKLPYRFGQLYLLKNWPTSKSQSSQVIRQQKQQPTSKTSSTIITSSEKYAKYLQKLEEESNQQKTERAYNLLSTLVINIYSNPNNQQSYRQVKRTNRQINDLLIKYKHGLKLLDELGFREKDEFWVNTVQSKYLKIYKTDFDLGFKKYKTRDAQK